MTRRRRREGIVALALALAVAVTGGGCGAGGGNGATLDGGSLVLYARDFTGFRSWPSHSFDNPVAQGSSHVAGARTVYISQLPPVGATAFPVGTMIVKTTETDGQIFARAKVGGNYNLTGAKDWEWYELKEDPNGLAIKWFGKGPPAGEKYAGDPNSGCNPCHAAAKGNDYVMTPWLQLSRVGDADADAGGDGIDGGAVSDPADAGRMDGATNESDGGATGDGDISTDAAVFQVSGA